MQPIGLILKFLWEEFCHLIQLSKRNELLSINCKLIFKVLKLDRKILLLSVVKAL